MSIVEKMDAAYREMVCARPVGAGDGDTYTVEPPTRERFRKAIITATGLTESQLEGLANGTMVCVPVKPTEAMKRAFQWGSVLPGEMGAGTNAEVYRAMLAAKEG